MEAVAFNSLPEQSSKPTTPASKEKAALSIILKRSYNDKKGQPVVQSEARETYETAINEKKTTCLLEKSAANGIYTVQKNFINVLIQFLDYKGDLTRQANPNFVTYLVDGNQHCFTPSSIYYEANTKGPYDQGKSTTTEMMYEWVNQYPLEEGSITNTRCDVGSNSKTLCDEKVSPKSFTEHWENREKKKKKKKQSESESKQTSGYKDIAEY
eukprot:gene12473-13646_t